MLLRTIHLIPVILLSFIILIPTTVFAQEAIVVEDFWSFLGGTVPAWVVIGLIALRQVSEVIAKTIPDTSTGVLAAVRKIFKIIAIYIPNKT